MSNLRAYHFGNFYLSSIQQGIQNHHALAAMAVKYRFGDDAATNMVWDWAPHPYVINLNGGNNASMWDIVRMFESEANPYPWSFFREDEDSLGGLLTNVAIILPEKIWDAHKSCSTAFNRVGVKTFEEYYMNVRNAEHYREEGMPHRILLNFEQKHGKFTHWEAKLVDFLRGCSLAR